MTTIRSRSRLVLGLTLGFMLSSCRAPVESVTLDPTIEAIVAAVSEERMAELAYLLMRHVGQSAQKALLEEIARGAYRLEPFDANDVGRAKDVLEKYADLGVGLADASLVVLAERHGVAEILTLDRRHFRAMRFAGRKQFRILPPDIG